MRAYERFLNYARIHTTSREDADAVPSTERQFDLANLLVDEMKFIGIADARADGKCYVYGTVPATPGYGDRPRIGFLAHLDTSPDASGEGVSPVLHEDYDGGDVVLESGLILSPEMFPHLKEWKGRTLITSDGTTLLGADDKAGIAEIMTMAERLLSEDIPHGKVSIAFTPDEEVGHGAGGLDLEAFGADFAYTVDGGAENEVEYENFNAAEAKFKITGRSVHPGDAKGKMANAALIACEAVSLLPGAETPVNTEGREGFFHLTGIEGNVERAEASFIVRDHSESLFEARLATLRMIEKHLNEKYGAGTAELAVREQYRNMVEKIRPHMHLIENAKASIRDAGLEPVEVPVRGGTDGAQLSFCGLSCPNIGTGGHAFHGPYEHISAEGMDTMADILLGIVGRYASDGV